MDIINTISVIKFLISRYSETLIELFYNLTRIQKPPEEVLLIGDHYWSSRFTTAGQCRGGFIQNKRLSIEKCRTSPDWSFNDSS